MQRQPRQPNGSVDSVHSVAGPSVEQVIEESLPKQIRQRHCQVFDLARSLIAIPWLADAEGKSLEQYVRRWHCLGVERGVIATVPFEETWLDFSLAWLKIKFPKGSEPMATFFREPRMPFHLRRRSTSNPGCVSWWQFAESCNGRLAQTLSSLGAVPPADCSVWTTRRLGAGSGHYSKTASEKAAGKFEAGLLKAALRPGHPKTVGGPQEGPIW